MRITIFAVGTMGDIRPFLALAHGLQAKGHVVTLATSQNFEGLITRFGVKYAPLTADYETLMHKAPEMIENGMNVVKVGRIMRGHLSEMASNWGREGRAAAEGAELLIGQGPATILVASLSDATGIPCVQAQLQPMTPCRDIQPMMLPPSRIPLPGFLNLGLYHALRFFTWQMFAPAINEMLRKDLGLKPYNWLGPYYGGPRSRRRVLYAYSPEILPKSRDWNEDQVVTGFWYLDEGENYTPPRDLADFLAAGEKPVYVGFGSIFGRDTERITRIVIAALKQVGCRAILATGWGGIAADESLRDDKIFVLQAAPHDWLFPRMAVAVHHGGAGTTAAAARAGIPSVIMPFITEQAFWSDRLEKLGAAPKHLNRKTVTVEALAAAIERARKPDMIAAAAALGERMQRETGVATAVAQLEEWDLLHSTARPEHGTTGPVHPAAEAAIG
ncbi:glycosyltransferase [Zavarzinia sp.]|uniref:glycosyltransferase n=1 Tax=Zavarzinia sp. TaxID=2027920 RepID=UPI003562250B